MVVKEWLREAVTMITEVTDEFEKYVGDATKGA